ncbi:MAG: J domain-containing protein [Bacteroidia bacterium]|nr:J domain-containing protein [Bacteroidia bacterium]
MVNFYDLLGIHSNATNEEILKAYRIKAKIYHPDTNNGSKAAETMFKMLGLAKETLLDPQKRLEHDYAVHVKERPTPQPKRVEVPVVKEVVRRENNIGQVIGWGLLGLIVGIALGSSTWKK